MVAKPKLVPHWIVCYHEHDTWWTSGPYSDKAVANDVYKTYLGAREHVYKRMVMLPKLQER